MFSAKYNLLIAIKKNYQLGTQCELNEIYFIESIKESDLNLIHQHTI